jgi:hypothetical protein
VPITTAEWRRNGKSAYGPPDKWNEYRCSGKSGSITVSSDVQKECRKFVSIGPHGASIYQLNDAGKAALKSSEVSA